MNDPRSFGATRLPHETLVDQVLDGRYRIDALIARGGMGSVYRAEELGLGRACALKVVTKDDLEAEEGDFVERFAREAATTARLQHPHCVSVLDFGETPEGLLYLAMELLEGRTLAATLRAEGPLELARFLRIATETCEGVRAAHALGIVHRDLKTANIFLTVSSSGKESVKVLDFGIAKRLHDTAVALTRPGQMLGTPTYMAPEQILAKPVDTRADVYSLGIVFFEMLVGRVPFDGTNYLDVLAGHAREPVPLMSAIRPDVVVPEDLEALVRRMLAKDPDDRPQDLGEVLEALAHVDASSALTALMRESPRVYSQDAPRRSEMPSEDERAMDTRVSRAPTELAIDRSGPRRRTEPDTDPAIVPQRRGGAWGATRGVVVVLVASAALLALTAMSYALGVFD